MMSLLRLLLVLAVLGAPVSALGGPNPPTQSITLAWDPITDPTVVGYNFYLGVASRTYTNMVDVGNTTRVTVSGLIVGTTYFMAVTAYNLLGLESDYSAELGYTVPKSSIVQLTVASDKQVTVTVTGQAGYSYDILATEDLSVWTTIGTVTLGAEGSSQFIDPNAANLPARFYRTQEIHP